MTSNDTLTADAVLTAAALVAGLQAGTYFTWATGVMPGLARADDRTFVEAMQRVNVAIVNPVFISTFLGAPVLAAAAAVVADDRVRPWAIAGAVLAAATVVITGAGNIPLNNALAAAGPVARIADLASVRKAFESRWVRLNFARSVTSAAALCCLAWAAGR
jgi:uncharacterized membrane protein